MIFYSAPYADYFFGLHPSLSEHRFVMTTVKKIVSLLRVPDRIKAVYLLLMILVMAILDTAGVASIAPFMAVVANPDIIVSNSYLLWMYETAGFSKEGDKLLDVDKFMFSLGVLVFIVMVFSISFKALTLYAMERFTQHCNRSLSRDLVDRYVSQPYSWFLNKHSADIGKAVLSEVNAVISGVLFPMMNVIAYGSVTICIMALLFVVDSWLSGAVGLFLGGIYLITYLVLRQFLTNIGEDRVAANEERYKVIQEGFSGIKDIKIFGLESTLLSRFDEPSLRYAKHTASQHIIGKLPRFLMEILAFGGMLSLVLYLMVTYGNFSEILPVLALYTVAAYRMLPSLQQVYSQLTTIRFSLPALDLLYNDFQALDLAGSISVKDAQSRALGISSEISLDRVTFQYEGQDSPAIQNVNLTITALSSVAFVGTTGSGKTTTVDLILGLLRPLRGEVKVDGAKIDVVNLRAWQNTIGYVPQHIYLSDESIAANIAFGRHSENIDYASVERAAKIANLHDFVISDLPSGYETKVGEQGVRLSGGQRQRIGIARALYYDPSVLVFDEATSALDSVTEKAVMEAIENIGNKKTIILIAHRLSTVRQCDKIFVMDQGGVVGEGTYDQLMESSTKFRDMVKLDEQA